MLELVLDTSVCTAVAIVADGRVVARQTQVGGNRHAESLSPLIESAVLQAGLPARLRDVGFERIVVGTGPGPFTGLRAGLVTARTLGFALDVPVLGVSSLEMLARRAFDLLDPSDVLAQSNDSSLEPDAKLAVDCPVLVVSDAKRREVYWGLYRALGAADVECLAGPHVSAPADLEQVLRQSKAVLAGPAVPLVLSALAASPILDQDGIRILDIHGAATSSAPNNMCNTCNTRIASIVSITKDVAESAKSTPVLVSSKQEINDDLIEQSVDVAVLSRIVNARLQNLGACLDTQRPQSSQSLQNSHSLQSSQSPQTSQNSQDPRKLQSPSGLHSSQNATIQQVLREYFPVEPLYLRRPDVHQK